VHLVAIFRRNQRCKRFTGFLGGRFRIDQAQTNRDAVDVRIDGEDFDAEREHQHAVGGLRPNAGEVRQILVRSLRAPVGKMLEVDPADIRLDLTKDLLNPRGLNATQSADANVAFDFIHRRAGDLIPRSKSSSQLSVSRITVGGGGVLREDRTDEHIDAFSPTFPMLSAIHPLEPREDRFHFATSCQGHRTES